MPCWAITCQMWQLFFLPFGFRSLASWCANSYFYCGNRNCVLTALYSKKTDTCQLHSQYFDLQKKLSFYFGPRVYSKTTDIAGLWFVAFNLVSGLNGEGGGRHFHDFFQYLHNMNWYANQHYQSWEKLNALQVVKQATKYWHVSVVCYRRSVCNVPKQTEFMIWWLSSVKYKHANFFRRTSTDNKHACLEAGKSHWGQ